MLDSIIELCFTSSLPLKRGIKLESVSTQGVNFSIRAVLVTPRTLHVYRTRTRPAQWRLLRYLFPSPAVHEQIRVGEHLVRLLVFRGSNLARARRLADDAVPF